MNLYLEKKKVFEKKNVFKEVLRSMQFIVVNECPGIGSTSLNFWTKHSTAELWKA